MSVRLAAVALAALVLAGPAASAPTRDPGRLTLPSPLPTRTVHVPILMYHRIDALLPTLPAITRSLTVDPKTFTQQMTWLVVHHRHTITQRQLFAALMDGKPLPAHPVMITFDDGYRDVYQRALPILERLHLRATAYVITDRISGPDPSFLDWQMLRWLERAGVAIGSHTVSHVDLTSLGDREALAELVHSRQVLEHHLGHPVQWLSYPGGSENAHVVALARTAGYVLAVTTQPGADQSASAPLELHRYRVLDTTALSQFAAFVR
jgi:peptidoglycan/xylan/chitin deacetylase (PgdA/CDA1 family)